MPLGKPSRPDPAERHHSPAIYRFNDVEIVVPSPRAERMSIILKKPLLTVGPHGKANAATPVASKRRIKARIWRADARGRRRVLASSR
jgi:hypothetical protein